MTEERPNILRGPLSVINLGVDDFAESLRKQDTDVISVDWTPPAGGDPELAASLDRLQGCDSPNDRAVEAVVSAQPVWEDIAPAGRILRPRRNAERLRVILGKWCERVT